MTMGLIRVIFEGPNDLYSKVEGILHERGNSVIKIADRRVQTYFFQPIGPSFISPDFISSIGDFSDFQQPISTGRIYGPANVFGISLNTDSRSDMETQRIEPALRSLQERVQGICEDLKYVGIFYHDHDLLNVGELEEEMNEILQRVRGQ